MVKLKSILLIEDDPITNFINTKLIRGFNISDQIIVKKSGQEALDYVRTCIDQGDPCAELIFLDINMPVLDGFEFMMEFKKSQCINEQPPVIVILSTSNHEFDRERFLNLGVKYFIQKPLTKEKLTELLSQAF